MLYGVFADVHSNYDALSVILKELRDQGVEEYCCVGDIVGYAAEPSICIEVIKDLNCLVSAGNHDYGVVNKISIVNFSKSALDAVLWTRDVINESDKDFLSNLPLIWKNNQFTMVHGTLHKPHEFIYMHDLAVAASTFNILETPLCFTGHTHVPVTFYSKAGNVSYTLAKEIDLTLYDKVVINPGSVGQPRDGNPKSSYVLYDSDQKKITFKRVKYNFNNAAKKIYSVGLPTRNGVRLCGNQK